MPILLSNVIKEYELVEETHEQEVAEYARQVAYVSDTRIDREEWKVRLTLCLAKA